MTKDHRTLRADFQLGLLCPDCERESVTITLRHPAMILSSEAIMDLEAKCECGRTVNFGGLPARIVYER